MPRALVLAFLLVGFAASPLACAHGAEQVVRGSVRGGLEGGLDGLNDPHNKELLLRLLNDQDIHEAAHDLTAVITGGALDGLSDAERQVRLREASDAYIRVISASLGKALGEDISPALARTVKEVVGGAVGAALQPANRRLANDLVDGVTRSVIVAFTQSTAQGLRDDLGPALEQVIEHNLGPALARVIENNLQPAVAAALGGGEQGSFARALTKQVVLGVNDGMSELGVSPTPNKKDGFGVVGWLLIVLGTMLLVLTLLLVRMFFIGRNLARDRRRSEEMLATLVRALQGDETPGSLGAVIARFHKTDKDPAQHSYLAAAAAAAAGAPGPHTNT